MENLDRVLINREKIHSEVPDMVKVLKEMKEGLDKVTSKVQSLTAKVKEKQFATAEGIDYLEAKHLLLISYCQSLVYYLLRKAEGLSIEGHPVVQSLVEIKLFLEKIRPIDKKCAYRIERLLRTSATDAVKVDEAIKGAEETKKSEDLLKYRPKPDNLISKIDADGLDSKSDGHGHAVYQPPKLVPTSMEGDGVSSKYKKNAERKERDAGRKARESEFLRNMMDELEGKPEEVRERVGDDSVEFAKYARQWEKREQQEEELFSRAPITKAEKRQMKQIKRSNGLLGLADFYDEVRALPLEDDTDGPKSTQFGGSRSMEKKHNKRKRKY
ncbi:hypothetical protein vseg_004700 [Gypsophila vaccaria]